MSNVLKCHQFDKDIILAHSHCLKQNWIAGKVDLATIQMLYNRKGSLREISLSVSPYVIPLVISYHLYFLRISKVLSILHHGSVEWVHSKE